MFKFFSQSKKKQTESFQSATIKDLDFPLGQDQADPPVEPEPEPGAAIQTAAALPVIDIPAAAPPDVPPAEVGPKPEAPPPEPPSDAPAEAACPPVAEAPEPVSDSAAPQETEILTAPTQDGEAAAPPVPAVPPIAEAPIPEVPPIPEVIPETPSIAEVPLPAAEKPAPCTWREALSEPEVRAEENAAETPPSETPPVTELDPHTIPKFAHALVKPPVYCPVGSDDDETEFYVVDISQFKQQVLPPGYPETTVWGYGGTVRDCPAGHVSYHRGSPGATFETIRHVPIKVRWVNKLTGKHLFAVDPTLHWANPNDMPMDPPKPWPPFPPGFPDAQCPVPTVTHLHGGETSSISDGHPDAWFTANGIKGPAYCTSMVTYPNGQEPTTLWYHDHAMGITRLNVYAGLAGFYLLRDRRELCCRPDFELPRQKYEIPIVIQDRSFNSDGSLRFTDIGVNPDIHPYWDPEFFGDAIMVNGRVWPNLNVERRQYRFRLLNGSNARFYRLRFSNSMPFVQIGTDGGFLPGPVTLDTLLLAPAERADILVDFSGLEPGTKITLVNDAPAPFPDGDAPDPETTGLILQFTVPPYTPEPVRPDKLPAVLNIIPTLVPDAPQRLLTLYEVPGPNGPLEVLLNGQTWSYPVTERPRTGATEDWVILNLTMDTHPIHLHLIQFLLLDRQDFRADDYRLKWEAINGPPPIQHPVRVLPVEPYLLGVPHPPDPNERGWKDTIRMNPGQVTRIRVRFAPQSTPVRLSKPGRNFFPFDPTAGPGYVWHCHILDHEDNEMMRPFEVEP